MTSKSLIIIRKKNEKETAEHSSGRNYLRRFHGPYGVEPVQGRKRYQCTPRRINEIVHGKRAITADTALRLSRYLGTSAQFWLNLQSHFDLENEKDKSERRIEKEVHPLAAGREAA